MITVALLRPICREIEYDGMLATCELLPRHYAYIGEIAVTLGVV